ncbi:hypothetical protein [Sphaerisporangium perillae]|uniref:hypothetical protein n=1 Tax=Sphaerisporangium perillae TaxID=2935860 RepID=UPI00200DBB15|nr:hypothetical protein [Sphaerisporangium perillae]
MKLRAHVLRRLSLATLGLIFVVLGLEWTRIALAGEDDLLRLERFWHAQPSDLTGAAVGSIPLLVFGAWLAVRAPIFGVTCGETVVKVQGPLLTRRVRVDRITGIRRTLTGGADLRWEDEHGWPKFTHIRAFSSASFTRWAKPAEKDFDRYNEQCIDALKQWIARHAAGRGAVS